MKDAWKSLQEVNRRAALQAGAAGVALAAASWRGAAAQGTPIAAELLQQWAAGWSNLGDPAALTALVTDEIIYEDVAVGDVVEGSAAFAQLLTDAHAAIPDFTITLETTVLGDGQAAAEYVITGTQSGDLPYLAATDKPFSLRAASIFILDGGKIQRESRYYSMLTLLTQLGALRGDVLPPLETPMATPPA